MSKRLYILVSLVVFLVNAGWPTSSFAGVNDLPGFDAASSMKEYLKLTDDQVTKLTPVITTRINKVDAALATVEAADEQVTKLQPAMTTSVQKKLDLFQELADSGRIGVRDKLKAKKALDSLNSELEKSMSAVRSPDQVTGYKALKEAQKEARKAKK